MSGPRSATPLSQKSTRPHDSKRRNASPVLCAVMVTTASREEEKGCDSR